MEKNRFSNWRDELKNKPKNSPVIIDSNTWKVISEKQIHDERVSSLRMSWVSAFESIFREIFGK